MPSGATASALGRSCGRAERSPSPGSWLFLHALADHSITYAVHHLPLSPRHFIARIGTANEASISLFERLGFGKVRVVEVWSEAEMRWGWTAGGEYDEAWADAAADTDAWPKSKLEGRIGRAETVAEGA
jgi:hypothetical protein